MATYRLQKILARGGLASRRKAEELISAGRVRVNGRIVTELGAQADPIQDKIEVDGKRVIAEPLVYVVLHKPRGVVSTMSDPEGRPTVKDYLARVPGRVYSVGRLDFATSGVLLATNDGDFSDALLHPRKSVPKTYVVKVVGEMQEKDLERWAQGVRLDDGMTRPADLMFHRHEDGKTWFELTIREGRNQQIRRMGEATGFPVMRLARISFAGISSESLRPGDFRHLTRDELMELRKEYGVPKKLPTLPTAALEARTKRPARAPTTDRHGRAESRHESHDSRKAGAPRTGRTDHAQREDRAPRTERPQRAARPHDREERPTRASRSPDGSHIRDAINRTFEKPSRRPAPPTERVPRERPGRERPTTERVPRERPGRERPTTERRPTERASRERPGRERPTTERVPRERPGRERPTTERRPTERVSRERPGRERPTTERRPTERTSRERPPTERRPTERVSRERPGRERPTTERRPTERTSRERPPTERASRGRPGTERPSTERPSRERPFNDRAARERPARDHHSMERTPRERTPMERTPMERRHPAGGPPASSRPTRAESPKEPHDGRKAGVPRRARR